MSATRVLIVGFDYESTRVLRDIVLPDFDHAEIALNHAHAMERLREGSYDLVLLCFTMDPIWRVVCQSIQRITETPVLLVFGANQGAYIVPALRFGGDDFISEPFDRPTLSARIHIVMRRRFDLTAMSNFTSGNIAFDDGYLLIDLRRRRVEVNGRRVDLTSTEYAILACLVRSAGQVLTYDEISEYVWSMETTKSRATLHSHISRLRTKVEQDPRHPRYLQIQYGTGYYFAEITQSAA